MAEIVVKLSVIMLNTVMLNVANDAFMLTVIMLNVVILSVMAPNVEIGSNKKMIANVLTNEYHAKIGSILQNNL
jgi:hypothetical protein